MDWARRPYSTWARLIDHPDAPVVRLRWFFTDLPFIDFPTVINNREWDSDDLRSLALGEVYGAQKPYNGMNRVPGLVGDHICGTPEQFMNGASWPPVEPPVEYGPDWIPLCCPRSEVAQVTAGARPASRVTSGYLYRSRVTAGARPGARVHMTYRASSRVTAGARPASTVEIIPAPDHPPTAGARPASTVEIIPSPHQYVMTGARPGSYSDIAVYCPAPTELCSAAIPGTLNHNCEVEYVPLNTDSWRCWPTAPGHTYRLRTESALGTMGYELYEGTDCGDLTLLGTGMMSGTPSFSTWTATATRCYLHWSYPFGTPNHVIVAVDDIT